MTVTASSFRASFTAFADATKYPDGMVNFWIAQSLLMMDAARWGNLIDYGTSLFVAHNLVLQGDDVRTAAFGGNPGIASGAVSSKSVDKVSISYDTSAASEDGAGAWNLTTYGQQYIRQARMMGMGPVQIDQQTSGIASNTSGGWPGPMY